jgi:hypothetical protein
MAEAHRLEHEQTHPKQPDAPKDFADAAKSSRIEDERGFEAGGINQIKVGKVGGHDVFIKPATVKGEGARTTFDPHDAVAMHGAMQTSAEALGIGHAVQPAVVRAAPGEPVSFVTKSAAEDMRVANDASLETLAKVKESDKINGAVADFLHRNSDRHSNNVLVNPSGEITLIDHDRCHEHVPHKALGRAKSVFFPSGHMGYESNQSSFADLPNKAQSHVKEVAGSDAAEIATKFGIKHQEAADMKRRAQSLMDRGLTEALKFDGAVSVRDFNGDKTYLKSVERI